MKRTRAELEKRVTELSNESGRQHCLINDLLNDKVKWFRSGKVKVGISRPNGAEGGLCIYGHKTENHGWYYTAQTWEDFKAWAQSLNPDSDFLHVRELSYLVATCVNSEQRKG